ncbi:MAG: hypothetical protein A3I26_02390 [Candidatus Yanofskybacteria bacterium RIFCSPLOWO2_02_FULL_43_10]|nr:MAG: hypothetical protein A2742_03860 [Candidatus Yanofskybacteria bacterium RIFCSPHIGHO2_01_FULL_43_32]OGN17193.1 MAG: hypothetical protein A3E34_00275 [Candidatus Yanofskybacteria bacterium RIFCSPHIGHO2_12_FULL_43_11]OGN24981.1 MAG: hypothetical protein A2923_03360 [Candidatus Yanofskybacteria bacterium RIFCSPLOWO2_01_FULL_43_46]OGN30141.1 MAG: hypothetical protein A3I26_02390 [Candidatus Yanofskybacteria bacterium RIFCSPLOWO2_02_FULL_43_10]
MDEWYSFTPGVGRGVIGEGIEDSLGGTENWGRGVSGGFGKGGLTTAFGGAPLKTVAGGGITGGVIGGFGVGKDDLGA